MICIYVNLNIIRCISYLENECLSFYLKHMCMSFAKISGKNHSGDNSIQNFHLGRYIVGYTFGNFVLRRRVRKMYTQVESGDPMNHSWSF